MTSREDDRPGADTVRPSLIERRSGQRRARIAAGVVGLTAVLGGGAYAITSALVANDSTTATDLAAPQLPVSTPLATESVASPSTSGSTSAAASPSTSGSASPVPTVDANGSPIAPGVIKAIEDARRKMAEDGVKVQRPVDSAPASKTDSAERVTKGSLKEGGILRMVTAHEDLTGQGELAAVAGGVKKHRNVPCSQTFRFSSGPKPEKKPNLLMCWRTSAEKSVIAILVDPKGHPSREKAVQAVQKQWKSMG